jgi:hypothetical protein
VFSPQSRTRTESLLGHSESAQVPGPDQRHESRTAGFLVVATPGSRRSHRNDSPDRHELMALECDLQFEGADGAYAGSLSRSTVERE